jgi:hypothetical protein
MEKEAIESNKNSIILDGEISWDEFFDVKESLPKVYVVREAVLRNIVRLNKEDTNQPVTEISGITLIEFLSRWSSQQKQVRQ